MYSRRKTATRRYRRNSKPFFLLVALAVVLCAVVGTTVAYLFANSDSVTNSFISAEITTKITEKFNNEVKDNVTVKNTGDVDAYIRAAVVVTWQDDSGKVYPTAPVEGTDYTVTWTMNGWKKCTGGYYYYTSVVAPSASTGILLTSCQPVEGKTPEDYYLVVEILASAIQSEPADAVKDAWGVTINNGSVTAVSGN